MNNPVKKKEEREWVTFEGPADAVYMNAPDRVSLDVGTGAAVQIVSKGWQDVVVVSYTAFVPMAGNMTGQIEFPRSNIHGVHLQYHPP